MTKMHLVAWEGQGTGLGTVGRPPDIMADPHLGFIGKQNALKSFTTVLQKIIFSQHFKYKKTKVHKVKV